MPCECFLSLFFRFKLISTWTINPFHRNLYFIEFLYLTIKKSSEKLHLKTYFDKLYYFCLSDSDSDTTLCDKFLKFIKSVSILTSMVINSCWEFLERNIKFKSIKWMYRKLLLSRKIYEIRGDENKCNKVYEKVSTRIIIVAAKLCREEEVNSMMAFKRWNIKNWKIVNRSFCILCWKHEWFFLVCFNNCWWVAFKFTNYIHSKNSQNSIIRKVRYTQFKIDNI